MSFTFRDETVATLMDEVETQQLVLPNFQRDFTWSFEQIQSLVASFLVNIPTGSLLLLKGNLQDFSCRALGSPEQLNPQANTPCQYLLDGQQRMTALRSALFDLFDTSAGWKPAFDSAYSKVKARWFLQIRSDSLHNDPLGYQTLSFSGFGELEPTDLVEFISYQRVFKTKTDSWWHPGAVLRDDDGKVLKGKKLELALARHAQREGRIPLYEISKGPDGWIEKGLEVIAEARLEELKAESADDPEGERSRLVLLKLAGIDDEITSFETENEEDRTRLADAWERLKLNWELEVRNALFQVLNNRIPLIIAPKDEIDRAVATFEAVNRGGTRLDNFDLVVARAAKLKSEQHLTQRIVEELQKSIRIPEAVYPGGGGETRWDVINMGVVESHAPTKEFKNWFLDVLSILVYEAIGEEVETDHIKSKKILGMSAEQVNERQKDAVVAIKRALAFLQFRCGLATSGELHYKLMLLPIAFVLRNGDTWKDRRVLDKLEYWYWTVIFAGGFRERQNERAIQHLKNLAQWAQDGEKDDPFSGLRRDLFSVKGYCDRELLLRELYEGHEELIRVPKPVSDSIAKHFVMAGQPRDLLKKDARLRAWELASDTSKSTEIHHLYPLFGAKNIEESTDTIRADAEHILNSPLNLTVTLRETNRKFGALSPEQYAKTLREEALLNHHVPTAGGKMYTGSTKVFLERRFEKLRAAVIERLDRLMPNENR